MTFRRSSSAFTLIEVMLALALIAMLAGAVSSFLWSLTTRHDALARAAAEAQAADTLLDRLESDLLAGLAGGAGVGAGVAGSSTQLRLLTRGVDLADGGICDLQEVNLSFSGGTLSMSRRSVNGSATPAVMHPLSSGLSRVRFRYFDGRTWKSSFDSAALRRLPAAIEIELWSVGRAPPPPTDAGGASAPVWPEPDRSRVIVVPDGPDAAWGGGGGGVGGGTSQPTEGAP